MTSNSEADTEGGATQQERSRAMGCDHWQSRNNQSKWGEGVVVEARSMRQQHFQSAYQPSTGPSISTHCSTEPSTFALFGLPPTHAPPAATACLPGSRAGVQRTGGAASGAGRCTYMQCTAGTPSGAGRPSHSTGLHEGIASIRLDDEQRQRQRQLPSGCCGLCAAQPFASGEEEAQWCFGRLGVKAGGSPATPAHGTGTGEGGRGRR